MAVRDMYVVLVREKGMFLVEPVPGMSQHDAVEQALGLGGGYSSGRVAVDLPEGSDDAWAVWVEGKEPKTGRPAFFFRAFDPSLTEAEVEARLQEQDEEPLKMNLTPIHWARNAHAVKHEPETREFNPD